MLFNSPTQFVVLALLLLVGWLFGFASHSGGKRWKTAYQDETVARAHDREELDGQLRQADARIVELERERAELARELDEARASRPLAQSQTMRALPAAAAAVPVAAAPAPAPARGPVAASAARPAFPAERPGEPDPQVRSAPAVEPLPIKRGWFDWSRGDDLTRLHGVDAGLAERLKVEKVVSFAEIAGLSDHDEVVLERRLDLPAGYMMKEQLREQARLLAAGEADAHRSRFG